LPLSVRGSDALAPEVCSSIGISIIPIPWIQTDKGRLKTDKIPPHPALSPLKRGED